MMIGRTAGFEAPLANEEETAAGIFRFTNAQPQGAEGKVELLRAQFQALGRLKDVKNYFRLNLTSAGSTGPAFENLLPLLVEPQETSKPSVSQR